MKVASRVMYNIANFFQWIIVILSITAIVFCFLGQNNVVPEIAKAGFNLSYLAPCIVSFVCAFITIVLARRAKADGTSKAWDILFIILGALSGNVFYVLGGIFGLFARK